MTALEIVQNMARVLGLELPQTLSSLSDTTAQRLFGILNRALADAAQAYKWQVLQKQIIFRAAILNDAYNAKTGGLKLSVLAPDMAHSAIPQIYEMGSSSGALYLPPDQYTQVLVQGIGGAQKYFTIMGGEIIFLPSLTQNGWRAVLRYISKNAVLDENGNAKASFSEDGDTCLLDDELLILGGIAKFKQEMGYDYADALEDYQKRLEELTSRDGFAPVLHGVRTPCGKFNLNIPETGVGQ